MQNFVLILLLTSALFPHYMWGGSLKVWNIKAIEQSPVMVVGRIGEIRKTARVPEEGMPWRAETWAMTAHVDILRSFSASGRDAPSSNGIDVRFFAYGPSQTLFINGSPPPLVSLRSGEVLLLPLLSNQEPAAGPWRLIGIEGVGMTIPVRAEVSTDLRDANSGREFILRELVNSLGWGTPEEVSWAGGYIHDQCENLTPELMPLLNKSIGNDERRWAAIAVSLMGTSRPTIGEIRAGGWRDANWNPSVDHGYSVVAAILTKLPNSAVSNRLIIDALIARMSFAPEYASFLVREYAADEYFASSLRAALKVHQTGALYVASALIRDRYRGFYPDAVQSARELIAAPATMDPTYAQRLDRTAAASLAR